MNITTDMTMQERINQCCPNAQKYLQPYHDALADAFEVPNESLPPQLRNNSTTGSSIAEINVKLEKLKKTTKVESDHKREKRLKAENIQHYRSQINNSPEAALQFREDEIRLHRAQVNFLNMIVKMGVLTEEDFE